MFLIFNFNFNFKAKIYGTGNLRTRKASRPAAKEHEPLILEINIDANANCYS